MLDDLRQLFAWSGKTGEEIKADAQRLGWQLETWGAEAEGEAEDEGTLLVVTGGSLVPASYRRLCDKDATSPMVLDTLGVRAGMINFFVTNLHTDDPEKLHNFFAYRWRVYTASGVDRAPTPLVHPETGEPYVPRCACCLRAMPDCPDPSYDFLHAMNRFVDECMADMNFNAARPPCLC